MLENKYTVSTVLHTHTRRTRCIYIIISYIGTYDGAGGGPGRLDNYLRVPRGPFFFFSFLSFVPLHPCPPHCRRRCKWLARFDNVSSAPCSVSAVCRTPTTRSASSRSTLVVQTPLRTRYNTIATQNAYTILWYYALYKNRQLQQRRDGTNRTNAAAADPP